MKKLLLSISQWCLENCPQGKLPPPPPPPPPHLVRARVCVSIRIRIRVGGNCPATLLNRDSTQSSSCNLANFLRIPTVKPVYRGRAI